MPSNKYLGSLWLERIGNPNLAEGDNIAKLKYVAVCEEHFDPQCIESNGKLGPYSLPTINLPSKFYNVLV
nr:unnamed protein product [Callosobruchus chinensis]